MSSASEAEVRQKRYEQWLNLTPEKKLLRILGLYKEISVDG